MEPAGQIHPTKLLHSAYRVPPGARDSGEDEQGRIWILPPPQQIPTPVRGVSCRAQHWHRQTGQLPGDQTEKEPENGNFSPIV